MLRTAIHQPLPVMYLSQSLIAEKEESLSPPRELFQQLEKMRSEK